MRGSVLTLGAAVFLAVGACQTEPAVDTTPSGPAAAPALTTLAPVVTTTLPPTTSSTTTSSTTTTAPPLVAYTIETLPVDGEVVVSTAAGDTMELSTPFAGTLPAGPASLVLTAPGHATIAADVHVEAGGRATVWLDKEGQLLHKLTEWSTNGAPKQVAFTPDGAEVWVTLLGGDGVEVFEPTSGELLATIDLPDAGAVEVIFNQSGELAYVSQMETASVYEIDVAAREVLRRLATGSSWTKVMALSPDERTLYASNWLGNDVSEIDLDSGELVRRIPTVTTPRGLYVTPDGNRLYVAGFEHGEIQVVDLASGEGSVIYRSGGAMRHLVGDPDRGLIYGSDMARANVVVVDVTTDEVTELAPVDRTPNTIDLSPDGRVLYVSNRGRNNPETYYEPGPEWGSIVLIDTGTGEYLDAIVGGNQSTGLDVSPEGTLLAFSDFLDDRVSVYQIPPYAVLAAGEGGRWEAHIIEIQK